VRVRGRRHSSWHVPCSGHTRVSTGSSENSLSVEFCPQVGGCCAPFQGRDRPASRRNPFKMIEREKGLRRAHSKPRHLMNPRSTMNLAVVLAALLFFSTSGLCAAFIPQASQPAHPCCPKHSAPSSDASVPRCCITTGGPVIPGPVSGQGAMTWSTSAVTTADQTQPRPFEAVVVEQPLSIFCQLYLQYHQLLI
jgi:hypothetical protein